MSDKDTSNRRDFLKLATVGAPAAAAVAVAADTAEAAEEPVTELGYRKTEHIKTYLETCRF